MSTNPLPSSPSTVEIQQDVLVSSLARMIAALGIVGIVLWLGEAYLPALSALLIPLLIFVVIGVCLGVFGRSTLSLLSSQTLAEKVLSKLKEAELNLDPK